MRTSIDDMTAVQGEKGEDESPQGKGEAGLLRAGLFDLRSELRRDEP